MATDIRRSDPIKPPTDEPEVVPLACVGRWVAWSSDGMRILAVADTIEEAERLAAGVGEPDPILQRPPAPHRL